MYKKQLMQLIRFLTTLIFIILSYLFLSYTIPYIYPLLLSVLFAYIIKPFIRFTENTLHFPRSLATLTVISSIFIVSIGIVVVISIEIYHGTVFLAEKIPVYFQDLILYFETIFNTRIIPIQEKLLSIFFSLDPSQQESLKRSLNELLNHIAMTGSDLLRQALTNIPSILSHLPNSVTILIFILIGTFLIANDWQNLSNHAQRMIPENMNSSTKKIVFHFKSALGGYVKAQLILVSISGALIFMGLLILQVNHALTIAILSTFVDIIPFIGTGIIFLPWIIYLFLSGDYTLTIGITILYMITVITKQILEPKILSSNIGIHPLVALIGYFLGLQIWGLFGLLIAPIAIILINVMLKTGALKWVWQFIRG
ncbi:sporulation integral membrane protein YtvI [Oceanobacillus senegalensis]|uniref:sporulation integral membrane protein YtvI n=1 Tax=Oceanobacillus senegalensis TaxID=1936063 RepID=UPI000A312829|nr:sporulation integral membrane protein YtvI [Oceanobacillus senegalensis]